MINTDKNALPLDLTYMKDMVGDEQEFLIEMLDTLVEKIPLYIEDLAKAIAAKNWEATSAFAHKMKPTFFYVGRADVRDHVQGIENMAREKLGFDQINDALAKLQAFLPSFFERIGDAKAILIGG